MTILSMIVFGAAILLGVCLAVYEYKEGRTVGRSLAMMPFLLIVLSIFIFWRSVVTSVQETFSDYQQSQTDRLREVNDRKQKELDRLDTRLRELNR